MAGLRALLYVSTAIHPLTIPEIEHLLVRAWARNVHEEVTGVLLYSHGAFMQYLEGPAAGVSKIYDIIKADPMHRDIREQLHEQIWLREFGEWSMAFRASGEFGMSHPMHLDSLLSGRLSATTGSNSASINLLLDFWSKSRGSSVF